MKTFFQELGQTLILKSVFALSALGCTLLTASPTVQAQGIIELNGLNDTNGLVLNGIVEYDESGSAVASGDINGDGIQDLIIGAPNADPSGTGSGATYVVFGSSSGFASSLELSALDGSNGFVLNGAAVGNYSGNAVSSGDINGDGIDDIIIGAENAGSYSGATYVVFGSSNGFAPSLELSALDGTNGLVLNGSSSGDESGSDVSSGDINGDGTDDVIIGAPVADPNGKDASGATYVVFGTPNGFAPSLELSALDGTNGMILNGVATIEQSGKAVSSGDINGDGIDDVIIGAPFASSNGTSETGSTYVVFGTSNGFAPSLELSTLDGVNGLVLNGVAESDFSGKAVSSGDINGDGTDDVIIGAPADYYRSTSSGTTYVVFGSPSGFAPSLELSTLDGANGLVLNGATESDFSGKAVSSGDINGDGIDDVIIGARSAAPNGRASGATFVVFGTSSGFASSLALSGLDGSNGIVLNGADGDFSGSAVSPGDINGDGTDDLIIGAPSADPNGNEAAGVTYVYYYNTDTTTDVEGSVSGLPKSIDLQQNFPNPFNPSTVISYQVPVNSYVTLKVYDMLGREAATLVNGETQAAGKYSVSFNAGNLASGMYLYRLKAGNRVITKKLTLIK